MDEIRDNTGYYYIYNKLNLNDFVIIIAYLFIFISLWIVYLIYPRRNDFESFDMIMAVVGIGFSIPFVAHFTDRAVKFFSFRIKKNKIVTKGMPYRAVVIGSNKGKVLFKDTITKKENYPYYPVVKVYMNGEFHTLTSKMPMSNSHWKGLKDKNVIVFVYKDEFIFSDFSATDDDVLNLEYIEVDRKYIYNKIKEDEHMWVITVAAAVALANVAIMALRIVLRYIN